MKKVIVFAVLAVVLSSCKDEKDTNGTLAYSDVGAEKHKDMYGTWSGYLEPVFPEDSTVAEYYEDEVDVMTDEAKKVSIKINRIVNDSVFGTSIAGGNQRPLTGQYISDGGVVKIILSEPGNDKYDGRFELEFANDSLSGKWTTYKKNKGLTPVKTLKLAKKEFAYNANFMLNSDSDLVDWRSPKDQEVAYEDEEYDEEPEGATEEVEAATDSAAEIPKTFMAKVYRTASDAVFKLNGSTKMLTEEELKNLTKLDLEIIRNTIFARHGYSFKRTSLRYFFEAADWYVPVSNNVDKELTKLEKANIALLSRMEQYATDHYEHFGR